MFLRIICHTFDHVINSTSEYEKQPIYRHVSKQPAEVEPVIGGRKQTVNLYIWYLNRRTQIARWLVYFAWKYEECQLIFYVCGKDCMAKALEIKFEHWIEINYTMRYKRAIQIEQRYNDTINKFLNIFQFSHLQDDPSFHRDNKLNTVYGKRKHVQK